MKSRGPLLSHLRSFSHCLCQMLKFITIIYLSTLSFASNDFFGVLLPYSVLLIYKQLSCRNMPEYTFGLVWCSVVWTQTRLFALKPIFCKFFYPKWIVMYVTCSTHCFSQQILDAFYDKHSFWVLRRPQWTGEVKWLKVTLWSCFYEINLILVTYSHFTLYSVLI